MANGDDPKVKGYKVKKNVRKSKAYKEDRKLRKKKYKTAGHRFHRSKPAEGQEGVKVQAQRSMDNTKPGKNDAQLQRSINKMNTKQKTKKRVPGYSTLGNRPKTIKKKKG